MPGLHGLQAVMEDSVDPCCFDPEGQIIVRSKSEHWGLLDHLGLEICLG